MFKEISEHNWTLPLFRKFVSKQFSVSLYSFHWDCLPLLALIILENISSGLAHSKRKLKHKCSDHKFMNDLDGSVVSDITLTIHPSWFQIVKKINQVHKHLLNYNYNHPWITTSCPSDVFAAHFADCHFNEKIFTTLGEENKNIEKQITWNVS